MIVRVPRYYTLLLFFLCLSVACLFNGFSLSAQIVINEICSRNFQTLEDVDGDSPDWIELYNDGNSTVDLAGYGLTDDASLANIWTFPHLMLAPGKHLVVCASDKNRKTSIREFHHWETAVNANDLWKVVVPPFELDSAWRYSTSYNDNPWDLYRGGFGYGDQDDSSVILQQIISLYTRKVFTVPDTGNIVGLLFHIDYDDAFVAWLNGVEIARNNIGTVGIAPSFNEVADKEREARMYKGELPENYILDVSLLRNGQNLLAIQYHNSHLSSPDFSAIAFLSVAIKDTAMIFGAVPEWFPQHEVYLHTDFKLSSDGDSVILTDTSGQVIAAHRVPALQSDHSFGRNTDGGANSVFFSVPTPGASNNATTGSSAYAYASIPAFSVASGFYDSLQSLNITSSGNETIRYTLDGSLPTDSSLLFDQPIVLDSTMVVRAQCLKANRLPGPIVTNSYFINDTITNLLPVVSLSVNSELLFDTLTGIYMKGLSPGPHPSYGANFWRDEEVEVTLEYFDSLRLRQLSQQVGLKIFGNYTRTLPQKSLRLIARNRYGEDDFDYPLFANKNISETKQFVLRNAGNDWNHTHLRDAVIHDICNGTTNLDVQGFRPCVVYLNGNFWGVFIIREKINEHFLADNYPNVKAKNVDLLEKREVVKHGDGDNFREMRNFVLGNDMSDTANYHLAANWLDMNNFIDYMAVEIFVSNTDWFPNNVRYWRERNNSPLWRFILWDVDVSLGVDPAINMIDSLLAFPFPIPAMFQKLVGESKEFRYAFINRFADLLNSIFVPSHVKQTFYRYKNVLDQQMPRQFAQWGEGNYFQQWGLPGRGTYQKWADSNFIKTSNWIRERHQTARTHLQQTFNLNGQSMVEFRVYPSDAGIINVNTLQIDTFPWRGVYFDSIPIKVTAIPVHGYRFIRWDSSSFQITDTLPTAIFNPDSSGMLVAIFDTIFDTIYINSPQTRLLSQFNCANSDDSHSMVWLPETQQLSIEINPQQFDFKSLQFSLFDLYGRKVLEPVTIGNWATVSLPHLTEGLYIYQLKSEQGIEMTCKIIFNSSRSK